MDILNVLKEWSDALSKTSLLSDAFRWIGWKIIEGLTIVCDLLNDAVVQIYTLMGLTKSEEISQFINDVFPIITILLTISVIFLGYFIIFKRKDTQLNLFQNLIIIMLVIVGMPVISAKVADLTIASTEYVKGQYTQEMSAAFPIIDDNVTDLLYVDQLTGADEFASYNEIVAKGNGDEKNKITSIDTYDLININENIDYEDSDINHKKLFESELVLDANGKETTDKFEDGWFDTFNTYYYRYHVNWGTIIFSLLAMTITLFFTCYKAGRLIVEIVMHQIIAPFIAVTDLASGQRIKSVLKSFISLFATLFLMALLLGVYFLLLQLLGQKHPEDINTFVYIVMQLVLCFAVIDGPNIIERIIGVDAGIKSGYQLLIGGVVAGKAAKGLVTGARDLTIGNPKNWRKNEDGKTQLGGVAGGVQKVGRFGKNAINKSKEGKEAKPESDINKKQNQGTEKPKPPGYTKQEQNPSKARPKPHNNPKNLKVKNYETMNSERVAPTSKDTSPKKSTLRGNPSKITKRKERK